MSISEPKETIIILGLKFLNIWFIFTIVTAGG